MGSKKKREGRPRVTMIKTRFPKYQNGGATCERKMEEEDELEINFSSDDDDDTSPETHGSATSGTVGKQDEDEDDVQEAAEEEDDARQPPVGIEGVKEEPDVVDDAMESDALEIELSESEPATPAVDTPLPDDDSDFQRVEPTTTDHTAQSAPKIPRKGGVIPRKGEIARPNHVIVGDAVLFPAKL